MSNKSTPNGFTLRFCRHRRRWGWSQKFDVAETKAMGRRTECFEFARRPEALKDLEQELREREALKASTTTTTTRPSGEFEAAPG